MGLQRPFDPQHGWAAPGASGADGASATLAAVFAFFVFNTGRIA